MTFTEAQWLRRRNFITASNVPAIYGLDKFQSAGDVQARMLLPVKQDEGSDATDFGHIFGPALIDWVEHQRNIKMPLREVWCEAPNGVMAATLDGCSEDRVLGAEAKACRFANETCYEYGDEKDAMPLRTIYQVGAQMICCPTLQTVYAPALVKNRRGAPIYEIQRDEDFLNDVETFVLAWHERHIVNREPVPDQDAPSLETMKRVERVAGHSMVIDDEKLWEDCLCAKDMASKAAAEWDRLRAILASRLGDAEVGVFPSGTVTFKTENAGLRLDLDALREDHPDIYETYAHPTTRSMMRFKVIPKKAVDTP